MDCFLTSDLPAPIQSQAQQAGAQEQNAAGFWNHDARCNRGDALRRATRCIRRCNGNAAAAAAQAVAALQKEISMFSQPMERVFVSMVTLPVDAKALPQLSVAPVPKVMLVYARIFPANVAPASMVADPAGITQNTLSFDPTLLKATVEPTSAVSELPIRKTKDALARFWKSRVSVPVRSNVDPVEKTPGKSVTIPAV